jgi:hypothetical protein
MQIIGSPLHKGQQRIIDLVKANHKYIVVNAGRQNGKSFLATQLILHWALNNPGCYTCGSTCLCTVKTTI